MLNITEDWVMNGWEPYHELICVYIDGMMKFFEPVEGLSGVGEFGGPLNSKIDNLAGNAQLHQFVEFQGLSPKINGLPLLYGIRHSGCSLEYHQDGKSIVIDQLEPTQVESDWPYESYPNQYPKKALSLFDEGPCDLEVFELMALQASVTTGDETWVHIIVPPSTHWGVSLWGKWGDAEQVQVIFSVDPTSRRVVVSNQCT